MTVVYESKGRKRGTVVRFAVNGIRHRQTWKGGRWRTEIKILNKWRVLVNDQLPTDSDGQYVAHPQDGVCEICGHIYSHLMFGARQPCDECRLEQIMERARKLEQAGIPMGCGHHHKDNTDPAYTYEQGFNAGKGTFSIMPGEV